MNKKLTGQILALIKTLKDEEIEKFRKISRAKSNYLTVFDIFIKYRNSKAQNIENKIDNEGGKIEGSYNDTKENLLNKLLDFIAEIETEEDTLLNKARKLIDTSRALITRKQYTLACERVYDSFNLLNKIKINAKNYHLYLEYLDLLTDIQKGRQYDIESRNLPKKFDDAAVIQWLNNIITVIATSNIPLPDESRIESFGSNLFFNLYIDYLKTREDYYNLYKLIEENKQNSILNRIKRKGASQSFDLINGTFDILENLYLLEIAIKINDKDRIEQTIGRIESKAHINFDGKFNSQIYIFLIQQIHNFRLNVGFDLQEPTLLPSDEGLYPKILDVHLFTDSEIDKTALRIEANKGILYLFTERQSSANKLFGSIKSNPAATPEMKFYLALFEIIAHRASIKEYDNDNYNNLVDAAKRFKTKGSKYSVKFLQFLINNTDRRIFAEKAKEYQLKNKPLNTFDKVLHYWLTTMQPTT